MLKRLHSLVCTGNSLETFARLSFKQVFPQIAHRTAVVFVVVEIVAVIDIDGSLDDLGCDGNDTRQGAVGMS